jgi:hypothetical protein
MTRTSQTGCECGSKNDCASLLIRLSYEKSSTKIGLMGGGTSLLNTIELPYLLNVGHNIYNFWCIMHYVMWSSNKLTFSFISILVLLVADLLTKMISSFYGVVTVAIWLWCSMLPELSIWLDRVVYILCRFAQDLEWSVL